MMLIEKIRDYFRKDEVRFSVDELRVLAQKRSFREVVEVFEKKQFKKEPPVWDVVGYCYYQMTNYELAIKILKKAILIAPTDYYSRFFLAISYVWRNKNQKAIEHLLECLRLHPGQVGEILVNLLPLVSDLENSNRRSKIFDEISDMVLRIGPDSIELAKVFFFQKRDAEISSKMLQGFSLRHFYGAQTVCEKGHGNFFSLGEPEKLRFVNLESEGEILVDTCPPYFAEIKDAKIVSGSSLIFVGSDLVISESLSDPDYGHFASMQHDHAVLARRNDALLVKEFPMTDQIEEGVMLCGLASNAYGHWFAEFLPKLRFLEKHPRFAQMPIIVDEGMPQAHYDFLAALVDNPTYRLAKNATLHVKNLVVAPTDTFFPLELVKNHKVPHERQSNVTIGALKYIGPKIRNKFEPPTNLGNRIFLSRRSSQWRRLENESKIIAQLEKFDFKTLFIEDYTFAEQVRIFQMADFIVAPNGSALNSLIFAKPSVKVILLGQKNLFNWGGWFGSFRELGYSPQYLSDRSGKGADEKHLDYTIPAELVVKKVQQMLSS